MITVDAFIQQFLLAVDFQDAPEIKPDTVFLDPPEWDSLAALGVIVMFDIEFSKTIIGDDLKNCSTILDLYKLLEK